MRIYTLATLLAVIVFLAAIEIGLDPALALTAAGTLGLLALTVRSEASVRPTDRRPRVLGDDRGSADQGASRDTR